MIGLLGELLRRLWGRRCGNIWRVYLRLPPPLLGVGCTRGHHVEKLVEGIDSLKLSCGRGYVAVVIYMPVYK